MPKAQRAAASTRATRTTRTKDAAGLSNFPKKPKAFPQPSVDEDTFPTPLKGTGFKDSKTALYTLEVIKHRSLSYQASLVNTLHNRANSHLHPTPGIKAAAALFHEWLEVTYPAAVESLRGNRGFRPIVSKDIVSKLRDEMLDAGLEPHEMRFADFYVELQKNARLGNQLVDNDPKGLDWEQERYEALYEIVPEGKETMDGYDVGDLWDAEGRPTVEHLEMLAWGWTPMPHRTLAYKVDRLVGDDEEE